MFEYNQIHLNKQLPTIDKLNIFCYFISMPNIKKVTEEGNYFHVRYRPPSQFDIFRTPQWAYKVANSVSRDAKVRMGQTPAGTWLIAAILIKRGYGKNKNDAMRLAGKIRQKIEE